MAKHDGKKRKDKKQDQGDQGQGTESIMRPAARESSPSIDEMIQQAIQAAEAIQRGETPTLPDGVEIRMIDRKNPHPDWKPATIDLTPRAALRMADNRPLTADDVASLITTYSVEQVCTTLPVVARGSQTLEQRCMKAITPEGGALNWIGWSILFDGNMIVLGHAPVLAEAEIARARGRKAMERTMPNLEKRVEQMLVSGDSILDHVVVVLAESGDDDRPLEGDAVLRAKLESLAAKLVMPGGQHRVLTQRPVILRPDQDEFLDTPFARPPWV